MEYKLHPCVACISRKAESASRGRQNVTRRDASRASRREADTSHTTPHLEASCLAPDDRLHQYVSAVYCAALVHTQ
jgi:hypothetical protein